MKASARIEVERCNGRDEVVDRRSQAPLSIRRCGERILLASSAAAPVGGDDLDLDIVVGPGGEADVGSVAATMVWPGVSGLWSSMTVTCDLAEGATLRWSPEPTVSVLGSFHRSRMLVRLAEGATCCLVEEIALGRTCEHSGRLDVEVRVERCGSVLVHHAEQFGPDLPGAFSSVSVGAARHVVMAVLVGVGSGDARTRVDRACAAAWLPVQDDAVVFLAVGSDRPAVMNLAAEVAPELRLHQNGKTIRPQARTKV